MLEPLLFPLYDNADLCRSSDKLSFYLFADDTNVLYTDSDINSLERVVNAELSKLQQGLVANNFKCQKVEFCNPPYLIKRNLIGISRYLMIDTNEFVLLNQKTYIKYLGILIDSNLTWKYHISYVII